MLHCTFLKVVKKEEDEEEVEEGVFAAVAAVAAARAEELVGEEELEHGGSLPEVGQQLVQIGSAENN